MIEGKDRDEAIRLTAEAYGISRVEAEFIVAIELGEVEGDLVVVDEAGHERSSPE